ncbi:MAG: Sec-independent protein translocase protein TatB [Pseudoxanthomonas sp.]
MFGISTGELFFVAIIALIVLGPERLPKATRLAGLWVRRARTQWNSVKDELERELSAEELKRSLQDAQSALRDTEQSIRDSGAEARREFDQMRASVQDTSDPAAQPVAEPPAAEPVAAVPAQPDPASATEPGEHTQHIQGESDAPRNA